MWLTMVIAVILFAGMLAVLCFGYQEAEKQRAERSAQEVGQPPVLSPWPRLPAPRLGGRTADQVVYELEHQIDTDLQDVALLLARSAPESASRLYRV